MRKYFEPVGAHLSNSIILFRTLSFTLLLMLPSWHIPDLLPQILPVLGFAVMEGVRRLHKKKYTAIESFFMPATVFTIVMIIVLAVCYAIPSVLTDVLYMHLFFITGILAGTVFVVCIFSVLFFYLPAWSSKEPLIAVLLYIVLSMQLSKSMAAAQLIYVLGFSICFMVVQIVLLCSNTVQKKKHFFMVLTAAVVLACIPSVRLLHKASVKNNGGLLEQTLFNFDFSQFLTLQNEIKINSNLVMVVHIDKDYATQLFRRMYFAGWDSEKGFFQKDAPGEQPQYLTVPQRHTAIPHHRFEYRERVTQEIFLVNFDPASFIALDYPVSVSPYTIWNTSAFKGAYKVESEVYYGISPDLLTTDFPSRNAVQGMTKAAFDFYTKIDEKTRLTVMPIAKQATAAANTYYDAVQMLLDYFREGDYRYSLHPGIAPKGNQLEYFITDSKKGYCSYFAFAYCLMLRSLGIPARVAAGFFLHPDSGVMNYFPVRANMAHAWVEVFFPALGWISFDPTTQYLAEGELSDFTGFAGGEEFAVLVKEIIGKRVQLRPQQGKTAIPLKTLRNVFVTMQTFIQRHILVLLSIIAAALMLLTGLLWYPYIVIRFSHNPRKVILLLNKRNKQQSSDFIGIVQKAKFAPICSVADMYRAWHLYRHDIEHAKKHRRRSNNSGANKPVYLLLFCVFAGIQAGSHALYAQTEKFVGAAAGAASKYREIQPYSNDAGLPDASINMQIETISVFSSPEAMLEAADKAVQAENWDTAAELLQQGVKKYPSNELFLQRLGQLYYDNGLYEQAELWFERGLVINRYNIKLLYGASNTAAALNKNEQARKLLYEYLMYNPTDIFGWSTYGWLCLKTHNTEVGIEAMLNARKQYGDNGSIANALGNLYGALFDYERARGFYTEGIKLALSNNVPYAAAVYYYNKAILEAVFYHFENAEHDARKAVEYYPQSSGYIMLGELAERQNHFEQALYYYMKSAGYNRTPLPLVHIAKMYLRMGYSKKAERYLQEIERVTDYSWIANFGMSRLEFESELCGMYEQLYHLKYMRAKIRVAEGFRDFFTRQKDLAYYALMWRYYESLYSTRTVQVVKEYDTGEKTGSAYHLYRNSFYYKAFKTIPYKAIQYLERALQIETAIIPSTFASYTAEKGVLLEDKDLLMQSLVLLDPIWEKQLCENVTAKLIKLERNIFKQFDLIEQLLTENPTVLMLHGIRLPVRLVCSAVGSKGKGGVEETPSDKEESGDILSRHLLGQITRFMKAALKKSNFKIMVNESACPLLFSVMCTYEAEATNTIYTEITLSDIGGHVYYCTRIPYCVNTRKNAARCVNTVCNELFRKGAE